MAGARAGLAGKRSGLFLEQTRITKEMRYADILRGRTGIGVHELKAPGTLCIKKCYAESIANLSVYLAKNINNRLVILRITRYHRHTGKYRNNSDGGDGNVSRCSADNSRPNAGYRR